jgi:beta-glucanase (GH16 family)
LLLPLLLILVMMACGGDSMDIPDTPDPPDNPTVILPSDLEINITIVNADAENPNGDGSGMIQCSATATEAVEYGFRFGTGSEEKSTSGNVNYQYTKKGTHEYTVYVYAYSSTGHSINTNQKITVYVLEDDFSTLIWSDEFDADGSPDPDNWSYDIGDGSKNGQPGPGWGNQESQFYTNRPENVVVEDGLLKITAKKENYTDSDYPDKTFEYTSTRMKTQGKFAFTYGRVEVRAKLPSGGGTWPAIWMLGSSISSVGWPDCGETDIMEHAGNRQGIVSSAMHTRSSFGNTVNKGEQTINDVSTAFHVYTVEWNNDEMIFTVDDVEHYRYAPANKTAETWPFDSDQFLILNVAMGGTFGGTIDPNFSSSSMEIDYVRVYQ